MARTAAKTMIVTKAGAKKIQVPDNSVDATTPTRWARPGEEIEVAPDVARLYYERKHAHPPGAPFAEFDDEDEDSPSADDVAAELAAVRADMAEMKAAFGDSARSLQAQNEALQAELEAVRAQQAKNDPPAETEEEPPEPPVKPTTKPTGKAGAAK